MTKVAPPALTTPPAGVAVDPRTTSRPARGSRFLRGRPEDPAWVRRATLGLLAGTGLLYLWGLGGSGYANAFYSAAVQAGSKNWTAFFYGSSDAANSITVDKPPAALWVMDLSVRLFGLSSWSILVPQALMGVATVALVFLTVRRVAGPRAGLLAGALTALTPVAVLIFRFNNPDALLTLLLTLAAYATTRAIEQARGRWIVLVGVLVGFGFLTKMLQALLVVPAFALAYLVAAPTSLRRRLLHLLGGGLALLVSAGWWVAIVEAVPASARPYIGGSQTNSLWELVWGYNGLGRLTGDETGSVTTRPASHWGPTGLLRFFSNSFGGQASWLLPAAVVLLIGALVALRGSARTDRTRAALLIWGGWLVVTWLVLSAAAGIIHPYYTVAVAPAIGAVIPLAGRVLWQRRERRWVRPLLAVVVVGTAWWAFVLLGRLPFYLPWLRWVVAAAGLAAGIGLLRLERLGRRAAVATLVAGIVGMLAGPAIFSWRTAASPHAGALPVAGPLRTTLPWTTSTTILPPAQRPPGMTGLPSPARQEGLGPLATPSFTGPGGMVPGLPVPSMGAMGTLLTASAVDGKVTALLDRDAGRYTWVGATLGSENAAGFQLATGRPVLPLGGFNASDPFPSLSQFQADVAAHRVHWFIGGGVTLPSASGSDVAHRIAAWVVAHYPLQIVDGVVLYDLSRPPS